MRRNCGGRPTAWKDSYLDIISRISASPAVAEFTPERWAKLFRISRATWFRWLNQHPEITRILLIAEDWAEIEEVERALHKRATGYDYTEEVQGGGGIVEVKRHLPPSPEAAKFYLTNRAPHRWSERSDSGGGPAAAVQIVIQPPPGAGGKQALEAEIVDPGASCEALDCDTSSHITFDEVKVLPPERSSDV